MYAEVYEILNILKVQRIRAWFAPLCKYRNVT